MRCTTGSNPGLWRARAVHLGVTVAEGLNVGIGVVASSPTTGATSMGMTTTLDGTEIFYKDWGSGQPIVFSHGWPLSADDWDVQLMFFVLHGYRVIAHDRRGHGRSTQT